jgi:hypothetical protein
MKRFSFYKTKFCEKLHFGFLLKPVENVYFLIGKNIRHFMEIPYSVYCWQRYKQLSSTGDISLLIVIATVLLTVRQG